MIEKCVKESDIFCKSVWVPLQWFTEQNMLWTLKLSYVKAALIKLMKRRVEWIGGRLFERKRSLAGEECGNLWPE